MSEPKKVGRRTFLNYAIAVVATGVIVGAATYFAVPKGVTTVTAPGTTVTTTKTVTTTVTGTPTTTPPTTTSTTTTTTSPSGKPVKIGCVTPLTGPLGSGGRTITKAFTMAVEDWNNTVLGRPIDFIVAAAETDEQLISEAERLITEVGCKIFVTGYGSHVSEVTEGVFEKYQVLCIDWGAWSDVLREKGYKWTFFLAPMCVGQYVPDMADKLVNVFAPALGKDPKELRVAIMCTDLYPYVGTGIKNRLDSLGLSNILVDYITFTEPVKDFTEIIERLKEKKVDIFIPVVSGAESAALLVRQSKQLGFKPPVFYAAGLAFEHPDLPKLLSDAPELLQGIFTHSFLSATIKHPPANEFYQRFYKRWGEYPSVHATEAYSAMIFLLECIQKTGSDDPAAVRETVKNADIPTGVRVIYWGIKFDERNQNIRANLFQVAQWQIIEGKPQLVCVGPPEIAMYNMIPTWKS